MKYRVYVREVWVQPYEVEAESKEEALSKVMGGEGDILEGKLEFSHSGEDMTTLDHVEGVS